jgi:hypothetical protein
MMGRESSTSWGLRLWQSLTETDQQREQRWSSASQREFQRSRNVLIAFIVAFEIIFLSGAVILWMSPTPPRFRLFCIAICLFYAALTGFGALHALRRWSLFERQKTGCCLRCGYDLRGIPLRCPECGTPISRAELPMAAAPLTSLPPR